MKVHLNAPPTTAILAAHEDGWSHQVVEAQDGSGDLMIYLWDPGMGTGEGTPPTCAVHVMHDKHPEDAIVYYRGSLPPCLLSINISLYVRVTEILSGHQFDCDVPQENYRSFNDHWKHYKGYADKD